MTRRGEGESRRARRLPATVVAVMAVALTGLVGAGTAGARGPVHVSYSVSRYLPHVPWGGQISTVSVLPGNDSWLAVASALSGGAYTSFNGGATWSHEDALPAAVQSVRWLPGTEGGGGGCPCLFATAAPDYEATGGGGLWELNNVGFGPHHWGRVSGVFPTDPSCNPATSAAHDIAIAPDPPYKIYVATDCGIAIGTPREGGAPTWTTTTIAGAPDQIVQSVIAFAGGHLIVAGPDMGVRYYDGSAWHQGSGFAAGTGSVQAVHGLAVDPRPGAERAYAITAATNTYIVSETRDGGATWNQVSVPLDVFDTAHHWPDGFRPGGIPNVEASVSGGLLHLYAGDGYITFGASVPLDREPYEALTTSDWSRLDPGDHTDTWDLAFHQGSGLPYVLTSDGGVAITADGRSFHTVGPAQGLDALQVPEITGQLPVGETTPDLYFSTWHDDLWSMRGTSNVVAGTIGGEGFDFGMPAQAAGVSENKISVTVCDACGNTIGPPHFAGSSPSTWPDAETEARAPVGNPTFVSPRRYVQPVSAVNPRTHTPGLDLTTDDGATWHQIADIPEMQTGWPRVSGSADDPTLFIPYKTSDPGFVVKLLSIHHISATRSPTGVVRTCAPGLHYCCPPSAHNCLLYAAMHGFGSLGVTPANTPWYDVYAVDPSNPNRLIAPDVTDNTIKRSTDGGATWTPIRGLAEMITQDSRLSFARFDGVRYEPNASVVSICPYNGSRALIGTREGGAYFSYDGGEKWFSVAGSDPIRWATAVYWLPGCASAYVGTFGSGIFRVDFTLRTGPVSTPCATPVCRLEHHIIARIPPYIVRPGDPGIIVSDGYIIGVVRKGARITVKVTAGSVVTPYVRTLNHVRVVSIPRVGSSKQATFGVFFRKGRVAFELRTHRPLALQVLPHGKTGPGLAKAPPPPSATLSVEGVDTIVGTALTQVSGDKPLEVRGLLSRPSTSPLTLRLDGVTVAQYDARTKGFDYVGKPPFEAFTLSTFFGLHVFDLFAAGKQQPIAAAPFLVPNADSPDEDDETHVTPTALTLDCPKGATAKGPLSVSGTLSPDFGGAKVTVTYSEPNGTIADTAVTDAFGNYSDTTSAVSTGTWTIRASFSGDVTHGPATSQSCTTSVS